MSVASAGIGNHPTTSIPRRSGRGRGLGYQHTTSYPRLSVLTNPTASASTGVDQTHESQIVLRVPIEWAEKLKNEIANRSECSLKIEFANNRIARCIMKYDTDDDDPRTSDNNALAQDSVLRMAVLFDLPTVLETHKAHNADTSQYIKVASISQVLLVLEEEDLLALPKHVQELIQRAEKNEPITDFVSESTDVETVFLDERAWCMWPHGLTAPMHDIRIRRKQVDLQGRLLLNASQTADTVENIVERLLQKDEQAHGVRVTLVQGNKRETIYRRGLPIDGTVIESEDSDEDFAKELEAGLSSVGGAGTPEMFSQVQTSQTEERTRSRLDAMIQQLIEEEM
jgi:TATA-binding protein-associated factor Taf7